MFGKFDVVYLNMSCETNRNTRKQQKSCHNALVSVNNYYLFSGMRKISRENWMRTWDIPVQRAAQVKIWFSRILLCYKILAVLPFFFVLFILKTSKAFDFVLQYYLLNTRIATPQRTILQKLLGQKIAMVLVTRVLPV